MDGFSLNAECGQGQWLCAGLTLWLLLRSLMGAWVVKNNQLAFVG